MDGFAKTFRDQRRALVGWGIGLAGWRRCTSPSTRPSGTARPPSSGTCRTCRRRSRTLIGDQTSLRPPDTCGARSFSSLGPILFLVFVVGSGARAVAGEEEAGTLDLVLSTPIRRRQVLFDKFLAMLASDGGARRPSSWRRSPPCGTALRSRHPASRCGAACLMLLPRSRSPSGRSRSRSAAPRGTGPRARDHRRLRRLRAHRERARALGRARLQPLRPLSPFRWYLEPDPLVTGCT